MNPAGTDHLPARTGLTYPDELVDQPDFRALCDYWLSVRGEAPVPRSADFDLTAIAGLLPDVTVLEVHNLNCVIARFLGTGIAERLGVDPTGQNLLQMQSENMFARAARAYQAMANLPCGGIARYVSLYSSGREAIAESFYLPLAAPDGEPPRLVCMTIQTDAGSMHDVPVERTLTGTKILSLEWFDLGFGIPSDC